MMESFKHCVTAFDIYFSETHEFWFSTDRKFANNDNVYRYNFNLGNVIKYVSRAPFKGTELQDLKKAKWYLEREIKKHDN